MAKNINVNLAVRDRGSKDLKKFSNNAERSFDNIQRESKSLSRSVRRSFDNIRRSIKKSITPMRVFGTVAAAAAGAGSLGYLIKQNIEAADKIAKTSSALNLSTEALQKYQYIAERSGIDTQRLNKAFERATARFAKMSSNQGAFYQNLKDTNPELLKQVSNLQNNSDKLERVIEAMRNADSETEKMRISVAAFGMTNAAIMTQLVEDSDKLEKRYEELGLQIDEKLLRGSESAKDAIDDLSMVIKRTFMKIVLELAPKIEKIATNMADWVSENKEFLKQKVPKHAKSIASGVEDVYNVIKSLVDLYKSLPKDVTGAGGYGLVGGMLFGRKVGAIIAVTTFLASKIKDVERSLKNLTGMKGPDDGIIQSFKNLADIWEATKRGEKWYEGWKPEKSSQVDVSVRAATDEEIERVKKLSAAYEILNREKNETGVPIKTGQKKPSGQPDITTPTDTRKSQEDPKDRSKVPDKVDKTIFKIEKMKEAFDNAEKSTRKSLRNVGISIADNISNNLVNAITTATSFKEAFANMAKSIGQDIMRMVAKLMILRTIQAAMSFGGGGVSPEVGSQGMMRPPQAANGNVFNGPKSGYLAELHGNEAVIPLQNGAVPVKMNGDKGSGGGNISITVPVTVEGGGMNEKEAGKLGENIGRIIEDKVRKVLHDEKRVGGLASQRSM